MTVETWFAFLLASAVLVAIPGPTVLLVISYSLGHGRKVAFASVAGVAMGDCTAMAASMMGLGVLLATSATLFTLLKWLGAGYLVYLGIKIWRSKPSSDRDGDAASSAGVTPLRLLLHLYVVTALNPKGIIFFVAFFPQFVDPAVPPLPQILMLGLTFLSVATINASIYAVLASTLRKRLQEPIIQSLINRVGGAFLIAAGLWSVLWRSPK